jgi:alpha-glucosidase (family GH31 glycosyl hydrolase)
MRFLSYLLDGAAGQWNGPATLELQAGQVLSVDLTSGGHWFGHGFHHEQAWPLESGELSNPAFAVNNIQSPLWLASAGFVILADTRALLEVAINVKESGVLRIGATEDGTTIRVFAGETLVEAHAAVMRHLGGFDAAPGADLLGDSFFCTWTQYPRCITQERILDMARQIRAQGYPCSRLIIDDRWESCFGELAFAPRDFPDPRAMFEELHGLGFKVWLWVTPFVNQEAATFAELSRTKALVPRMDGAGAATMRWWGGTAGLVDVTGPAGRKWYGEKLRELQALGADGFKIDGGDYKYQPSAEISQWHAFQGESGYSDALLAVFEEIAPGQCETRTAWLSQRRDILWRQGGKDSHWGADNGLHAMIILGLHLSLMGYDIFIPDMVPGRVQTMVSGCPLPTDELMVRWTEASVFMPMVQFSYFPWNYAPGTAAVVRAYADAHKALHPYLAKHARGRTAPLLRPVWFAAPDEEALYTINDEWLLGPDLLVAPVIVSGAVTRSVTLPPGEWVDAWTGRTYRGVIAEHAAPCPGIPLFVRAENFELLRVLREALGKVPREVIAPGVITATHQAGLDRDLSVTG